MGHSYEDVVRGWQEAWATRVPPTRRCMICECVENPKAEIVDIGQPWLCDNCKTILQKIIKEKQENAKDNQ